MSLTFDSEFIFIGRGDESFLENYSYELSDDPSGQGGKIYMALEILNNQAEAEDIGEAIFGNFKQKFYETTEGGPYERFEEALKVVNMTIETLKEEKVSRFIGNLNVALGAVVGENLFISVTGDAEVYLIRKRFVSIISEGLAEDSKKETFINIANGTLEPTDTVLFSSTRLLRYITKGELGKIFSENKGHGMGSALAELQDFIMTEILGRSAVLGIAVGEIEDEAGVLLEDEPSESRASAFFKKWTPTLPAFVSKLALGEKLPWFRRIGEKIVNIFPKNISLKPSSAKSLASKLPKIAFSQHMRRERILLTVLVLLVLLVSGVFWLRTRGDQRRQIAEQQVKLNHVRELMNDASTVGQFDKAKAADLLTSGEQETLQVLNSRYLRGDAVKTLDEIQKLRDSLDDVKRISSPTVLADFSEKRPTVSALGLLALKDRLYGFEYNALYEIVLDKLQDPLTISDIESVILGAVMPESNSLVFLTRTGKMIEYTDGRFAPATTKDGIWKKGVDMKSYNERLYVLDPERNQIWRYPRRRDGFDAADQYNQNADLKNGVSLAIDSSIYVLNHDGTITQLYQGQKQEYPLRKAPLTKVTTPTKIFTAPESNYLFVLEPSTSRVLLYRKDPQNGGAIYQTQYTFENVGVLRDVIVADNRLYVMDDKKVYFVNLSGL